MLNDEWRDLWKQEIEVSLFMERVRANCEIITKEERNRISRLFKK